MVSMSPFSAEPDRRPDADGRRVEAPARSRPATIVIPAYNEEEGIASTLQDLIAAGIAERYEVIIVDDGSTDRTAEIVAAVPEVRLVRHSRNRGYGAALKTGVRRATTDKVVFMDADGQHSSEKVDDIVRLLDTYPLVIGERDRESRQAPGRLVGKWLIRRVGEYLLGQELPDYNSGFRGFRTAHIRSMLGILPAGFSFSTTSTLATIKQGHELGTIPIRARPRVGRASTVKFFRDGLKTVLLILRIVMLFNPLRVFVPSSALFSGLGLTWAIYGVVATHRIPNGAVLVGTLGMMLFFIGLLADQIALMHLGREPIDDGSIPAHPQPMDR